MRRNIPIKSIMFELDKKNGILKILSGDFFLSRVEDAQCYIAMKTARLRGKSQNPGCDLRENPVLDDLGILRFSNI